MVTAVFVIKLYALFNVLYGGGEPLFPQIEWLSWLKAEGVRNALFMIIRIILLILGTSYLTYTTSPGNDDDHCIAIYSHIDRRDG